MIEWNSKAMKNVNVDRYLLVIHEWGEHWNWEHIEEVRKYVLEEI